MMWLSARNHVTVLPYTIAPVCPYWCPFKGRAGFPTPLAQEHQHSPARAAKSGYPYFANLTDEPSPLPTSL